MTPEDRDVEEALDDIWHYVHIPATGEFIYPAPSLCGNYTYRDREHHAQILGSFKVCFECSQVLERP